MTKNGREFAVRKGANERCKNYCQKGKAGIYSLLSLAPPLQEVRQVEIEAGDCEGRLPFRF